jgi:Asp-tRNA(Asn)/Glu-tRNA(Gln) amidotransferase A subunit family amidase
LATSVEQAARLAGVMAGDDPGAWNARPPQRPRLAVVRTGDWDRAQLEGRERFGLDCDALSAAGAAVESPAPLDGLDEAVPLLRTIMAVEGARALGPIVDRRPELASTQIRALIEEGRATPNSVYTGALAARERLIARYREWAAAYDAIVTLPAAGEAPPKDSTGDPRFCTRWTLLGAPAITLPTGLGPSGLPLGLQLVGVPGEDARLIAAARWAEDALPRSPAPRLAEA